MRIILTLLLCVLFPVFTWAGVIRGFIKDSETNEPLISATVVIKGTTIATSTDLNGYYELAYNRTGVITIVASYIGYQESEATFTFNANDVITHDFKLVSSSYELDEVVITVQAKGQIKALNQQMNADYISNVISSERLQEVPDATIADALARVPGITVVSDNGEGNKIQIRGMEPKLNLVTINGIRAPSADNSENSVGLAGISPFMIEEIEVQKSLTPDKDADVVGGIVDLKLKDAPEGFRFNAIVQNNFNNLVKSRFNPRVTLHASNRFFNNRLGIVLVGNYEDIDRSSQRMSAWGNVLTEQDPVRIETRSASFWTSQLSRKRYGVSAFLDYRLPNGKIKASTFMNGLSNDEFTQTYSWGFGSSIGRNINSSLSNTFSTVNTLQVEHKLFWDSNIELGVSYTTAERSVPENYTLNASYRTPANQTIESLPEEIRRIRRNQEAIYPYELLIEADFISDSSFFIASLGSTDNTFNENELTTFFDWKFPFHIGENISGKIKFGAKYRKKNRIYDARERGGGLTTAGQEQLKEHILLENPNLNFGLGEFSDYVQNNFSTFHLLSDYENWILDDQFLHRGFVKREAMEQIIGDLDAVHWNMIETGEHPRRNIADDYSGYEETKAAYTMAEINITKYLQLVGGVRYENIMTNYRSFGLEQYGVINYKQIFFGDSLAIRNSSFVLPMVNLKFEPTKWLQFRIAYSESVARPGYYSYMPRYFLTRLMAIKNIGNPYLKPARSQNLDAYVSVKTNNPRLGMAGVFTAGVFYKTITGYEYVKSYVNIHDSVNNVHPYNVVASNRSENINVPINNPDPAYSKGFEVDWQGAFIYLPKPLNGIVLNVNYTFTETQQTQHIQLIRKFYPDPSRPWVTETSVVDSSYEESMFSQPKYFINASIGYDFKGFSARLAYSRTSETFSGYFGSGRKNIENRIYSSMHQAFDLSVIQEIPWVDGLQLFLNVSNISSTFSSKQYVKVSTGGENYPLYEEYFGRIIILGLRFRL